MSIIAVIFDYDDTFVPDTTSLLLEHYGLNTEEFWEVEFKNLVERGYCPTHAYLKLLLDKIKEGESLRGLTNRKLREFGAIAAKKQYKGLHGLFRDLRKIVEGYRDIDIEFYIISGGLEEIIKGNPFVEKNFNGVYGCRLAGDDESNDCVLKYIKRCITFTEKTRYLFEINKGISPEDSDQDPSAVNKQVDIKDRRIPFDNMLYIGDGLTDIPCFSLIEKMKGVSCGIVHTERTSSAKMKIFEQILLTKRTWGAYAPRYGSNHSLGDFIRQLIIQRCNIIKREKQRRT
ncbi:MAG: HAD family hydrolase [Promethearchaeota archaeon]